MRVDLLNCDIATSLDFTFNLSSPTHATITSASTTITVDASAQLSVAPPSVAPGGQVVLTFNGYQVNASVALHVGSATGTVLGTFNMGSNGGLTTGEVTVKSTYKAGPYTLYAVGGGQTAQTTVTVT